jgi:hypothetical protein
MQCLLASPSPAALSSAGEDDSSSNQLGPPKAAPIVITTLADCPNMFILLDVLHLGLAYMPIVKLIAQKIGLHSPLSLI